MCNGDGVVYLLVLHLPQGHLHSLPVTLKSSFSLENGDVQLECIMSFIELMYAHGGLMGLIAASETAGRSRGFDKSTACR